MLTNIFTNMFSLAPVGKFYSRVAMATAAMLFVMIYRLHNSDNPQYNSSHNTKTVGIRLGDIDPATYVHPQTPDYLQNADQNDPRLIQHIRDHWLIAPPVDGDRNLSFDRRSRHKDFSEFGQPSYIDKLLDNRIGGFFLECGASDGTLNSNTLFLELNRSWTGLLVEANPFYFKSLLFKRRRAYLLNACLSPTTRATRLNFSTTGIAGGLLSTMAKTNQKSQLERGLFAILTPIMLQCFPLFSVLQAMGVNHVDYMSLDVEGAESAVLKTLPLNDVIIDAMTVETRIINDKAASIKREEEIVNLVSKYGYKNITRLALDAVLVREDIIGST